jgi:hypothetical protein
MQEVTCMQGLHMAGLLTVFTLQLGVPVGFSELSHTVVGAPGISQQPKQSQPLGVSGWQ